MIMGMWDLFLTFVVGIAASVLSGIAGAGGGLFVAPYLILIGLPPQIGVATAKYGSVGTTIGTAHRFSKTDYIRWRFVLPYIAISIPAAWIGSRILLTIPDTYIQLIVSVLLLVISPVMYAGKLGLTKVQVSAVKESVGYVATFILGIFQSAFGSGLGLLSQPILMYFFGFDALEANATKRIPGVVKTLATAIFVTMAGIVQFDHAITLFCGSLIGGYVGAHLAIQRGNAFVRVALISITGVMALVLLIDVLRDIAG